ncbi:hypothetical protein MAR_017220, partial [Mya arenaria]
TSDDGVLHITTGGVQYAVVHRQADAQRTETLEANARVPVRRKNKPTEYADIDFSSTQETAVEDPMYHFVSA